ncbi:MAG: choice-of-anchor A family protein [Planctomycetota bacterium]|nr:choice-of-anchor A family protein [Planctomycetota bacterium]MDP6761574.1 choice-of-anchor A family protein [Planctomycetota bacterium]MDP6990972.1 choice-of-anchor A family protein [Planctomycetota bacterium]
MITTAFGPLVLAAALTSAQDLPFPPAEFNVFSCKDINYPGGSDIEGIAGCVRDFDVNSFSLHSDPDAGPQTGISLYCGGAARVGGPPGGAAVYNGGLEVAGDISMDSAAIGGSVWGGGDATLVSGVVTGSMTLAGSFSGNPNDVGGDVLEGVPFSPTVDLSGFAQLFRQTSTAYGAREPNADWTWSGGRLTAQLAGDLNVIEIDAGLLEQVQIVDLSGPPDALLVVNVLGVLAEFDSITWSLAGGVMRDGLALNFPQAQKVIFRGGNHVTLLAPFSKVSFTEGLLTGNLIAGDLRGLGQVDAEPWRGFLQCLPGACPGTAFCSSLPNSTGLAAWANPHGSNSFAANDLVLVARDLPGGEFGLFFFGSQVTSVPFGNGLRCVDGDELLRLEITPVGGGGVLNVPVDLTDASAASAVIDPAETWHFQAWYRDPASPAPHFNTSDAYTITFAP